MKLFKRLRLKLGYFTRKELREFSDKILNKTDYGVYHDEVWHSDIENYIEDLKTKK